MKKSELQKAIREMIINELTMVDKMTTPDEAAAIAKDEKKDPNTVKAAIDAAKKSGKPVSVAEDDILEMAKISGDLKSSIEKVINANKDLDMLPLKKAIKADADVKKALGDEKLYDNQLGKFIQLTKGDREAGQRGRKSDPNKPKAEKSSGGGKGRPKSTKKKDTSLSTSKLGGRKYYTKKGDEDEGPSAAELRKLAKSGGDMGKDKLSQLKQQEKTKMVKDFLKDMKSKNVVDASNKVLDREKYDSEWAKTKKDIEAKVKKIK